MSHAMNHTILRGQSVLGSQPSIDLAGVGILGAAGESVRQTHKFNKGFDIRITPAKGGTIVSVIEANTYGSEPELHVISEDQDLGRSINEIITTYCLTKGA